MKIYIDVLLTALVICAALLIALPSISNANDSLFDEMDKEIKGMGFDEVEQGSANDPDVHEPKRSNSLDKETESSLSDRKPMDMNSIMNEQREMLNRNMEEQEGEWEKSSKEMQAQWDEMVRTVHAQREALKKRVEQQWDTFYDSTNVEWVDYSDDMGSRSRVDFEEGEVELSVLVPVEALEEKPEEKAVETKPEKQEVIELNQDKKDKAKELAEDKIKKQIKKVLSEENEVRTEALKDQIKDPEGKTVDQENAGEYVEKYVAPEIKIDEKPVVGKDGIPRVKATVKIKMVPEHLRIRAEKYKEQVDAYSEKYNIEPALIYAVIHTESYFNPLAKSYIPAFGLMQLVPKSGALDAYNYLYKEKKLLSSDYLYNPDNNIMLGSTYLNILLNNYFKEINNQSNKQTLIIAAYNWGTGRIKRKIVKQHEVDELSNEEVVRLINEVAPKETRDYVDRVNRRMELYSGM